MIKLNKNMTELLFKEKLLPLSKLPLSLKEKLRGVLRIVDQKGKTFGLFLDKQSMEDLIEHFEYSSSEFWEEIKKSRKSGEVSSRQIKHRLDL